MKNLLYLALVAISLLCCTLNGEKDKPVQKYALLLHGGAGNFSSADVSPAEQKKYYQALDSALTAGLTALDSGASSVEAVIRVIRMLEDNPLFNAGRGSVLNHEGRIEMDASIMSGSDLSAGAVAGLTCVRNPILLAAEVMEHSEHVFLSGEGALNFAKSRGIELSDSAWFYTEKSIRNLNSVLKREGNLVFHPHPVNEKFGTVGCVALDSYGNLAAGTSTGGMTNKLPGRIGDAPVIGAGTYANNKTCAVSCTGHGEYFIRYTVAHDISALMEYKKMSVSDAASEVIHKKLLPLQAFGGAICIDHEGNYSMEFNTSGMFRAYGNSSGEKRVLLFR